MLQIVATDDKMEAFLQQEMLDTLSPILIDKLGMNPKEFGWAEDQQVTVKNPTQKDFTFKVHNKEYTVPAGKTVKMPGYIAWVYVYHISAQEAQNTNISVDDNKNKTSDFSRWNEEGFRQKYFTKFVSGTDSLIQTIEEIEPEDAADFEEVEDDEPSNVTQAELEAEEIEKNGTTSDGPAKPAIQPMQRRKRRA